MPSKALPLKHLFDLPDDTIYLDGNSLGPLPKAVPDRVNSMLHDEWGKQLIKGWNDAAWMEQPVRVGDRIARLIGANTGTVVMGDTLSIKVYQALAAALSMQPERRIVLSDSGNFPTDLYMAEGLIRSLDNDYTLKMVKPGEVAKSIDDSVAVVMLTQVDYRSGRMHDMQEITALARQSGAIMLWDLAHSAGAVPLDLAGSGAEMAVGCTYKYLNGGPGAPAFIYVRNDLIDSINPCLSGWLGHEAPFAFDLDYRPAQSIERMRVGTPPVMQLTALEAALDIWDGLDMCDIRNKSITLSQLFIHEVETRCPQLQLVSPRDPHARGSQVSFAYEHGYAAMRALIDAGVIGDFRAPDVMRFGFTPLYLDEDDIISAAKVLQQVIDERRWENLQYQVRSRVT